MLRQPAEQIRNEVQDLQQADASIGPGRGAPGHGAAPDRRPRRRAAAGAALGRVGGRLLWLRGGHAGPARRERAPRAWPRAGRRRTHRQRQDDADAAPPRFYDPLAGVVRLGGVDLREVKLAAVRARIGLVTQEVHLFNASVRDNLTLFDDGVPDERISACWACWAWPSWLRALPHGLDTPLGPAGVGLSAGQAQVLACARILLRDPDVVILDEASSRLDPATERLVHTALGRLLDGRTGIIVAHRLATIAYADDILVLEDGQVREHGPRPVLAADPASRFAGLLRVAAEEVAFMTPLPTWRYLLDMARYAPWLYLLHAVLWGMINCRRCCRG